MVKTDAVKAEIKAWPPLKKAIWDVIVATELNGPAYVNAWDLVDKLFTAALSASPAGVGVETPPPQTHVAPYLTNEQREITLLRIIEAMGGTTDSSENPHSWLNWFCSDEVHNVQEDTFNRCEAKGWIFTTHNSDWDTSTTTLTNAGRAVVASMKVASHD